MATAQTIATNALRRARIIDSKAPIEASDLSDGLALLAEMIDGWAAQGWGVYGAFEGTTTINTKVISDIDERDVTKLFVGMIITGTGIPGGTFIAELTTSTSITLNNNATQTNADIQIGFSDLPIAAKFTRWITACLGMFACQHYGQDPNDLLASDAALGERLIAAEYRRRPGATIDAALMNTGRVAAAGDAPFNDS